MHMNFEVSATATGTDRLDRYLQLQLTEMSRSRLQDLIKEGLVLVNDKKTKPSAELRVGDRISVTIPEPVSTEVVAQDIPIDVLYEDADLIVINKSSGLVVHPSAGNPDGAH